jgi:hypothetical protein
MKIDKYERLVVKIGIGLLLMGSIIEGIKRIQYGPHPQMIGVLLYKT